MPATTGLVATTAPAPMLDRGVKDATSPALALQVCMSMCASCLIRGLRTVDVFISGQFVKYGFKGFVMMCGFVLFD